MSIFVEKSGPVTTVIMERPDARNAVDPATADALVAAFEAFNRDPDAKVAVFFGSHGTFCAGWDLKYSSAPLIFPRQYSSNILVISRATQTRRSPSVDKISSNDSTMR